MNTTVGDLNGNTEQVIEALGHATAGGADLAVFPELTLTGYPPEDLLLKTGFIEDNLAALAEVARATTSCVAVVGFVDWDQDLFNAAAVCHGGLVMGRYHKRVLPNYSVFDEQRYFASGSAATMLYGIGGVKTGVSICEDAWSPNGPIAQQAAAGAELMININASPYFAGKRAVREHMLATRAADASVPLVYVNQIGGQDELLFDGASLVLNAQGEVVAAAGQFTEEILFVDLDVRPGYRKRLVDPRGRPVTDPLPINLISRAGPGKRAEGSTEDRRNSPPVHYPPPAHRAVPLEPLAEIYRALVLGTADYVRKNRFDDVVLGLSGGIDSSLVAAIAVDALGCDRVHGVSMPSRHSSEGSLSDAVELATNLGIDLRTIPIEQAHAIMGQVLGDAVGGEFTGLPDENLQSRLRGVILMGLSNQHGWLVLTTGNKSELAVGYSTLYGDSAGGFAVIKDVAKTMVYELSRWRNSLTSNGHAINGDTINGHVINGQAVNGRPAHPVIPEQVIAKAPSAELRPDQRDDQSLPPYDVLDPILEAYIEDDQTAAELIEAGFDPGTVRTVVNLVDRAEYKRRQSPVGVRVTPKAFGKDRRMPITNRYPG